LTLNRSLDIEAFQILRVVEEIRALDAVNIFNCAINGCVPVVVIESTEKGLVDCSSFEERAIVFGLALLSEHVIERVFAVL
jgi:RNase P/RNase MRP subunit POP5